MTHSRPWFGLLRSGLHWNRLYRGMSYVRSALWLVPFTAVVGALLTVRLLGLLDRWFAWDLVALSVTGAEAMFQTVITLALSFTVFTFGSLLVALQIASAQLTPRIIATTLLRDRVIKNTVGLNVFTLLLAIAALNRTEGEVLELVTLVVALLGIACLVSFLFLIDYAARLLRPVRIVALVCDQGYDVVGAVYPQLETDPPAAAFADVDVSQLGSPARVVTHAGRSQIVLAVDLVSLVAEARRCDGVIEFLPQVGDFLAEDEPLFHLYGGAVACDDAILREAVAFGPERTMEQDPTFSFRILADVALKALSPAINDPTTAVVAIDQIHRLLRVVGKRQLHDPGVRDDDGRVWVVFRKPDWEDFLHVSCSEIRACGANNLQIARRLRAMLQNLIRSLPPHRHTALRQQLDLLDRALPGLYPLAEDLALARIPDPQGLGGTTNRPQG